MYVCIEIVRRPAKTAADMIWRNQGHISATGQRGAHVIGMDIADKSTRVGVYQRHCGFALDAPEPRTLADIKLLSVIARPGDAAISVLVAGRAGQAAMDVVAERNAP